MPIRRTVIERTSKRVAETRDGGSEERLKLPSDVVHESFASGGALWLTRFYSNEIKPVRWARLVGFCGQTRCRGRASNPLMNFFRLNLLCAMTATILLAALIGCGDPKTQAPAIVVTFDPYYPPPSALETGATAGIAADVANDVKNAGVNFTCAPIGACGTFSIDPIASAVPTTFQAPSTFPLGGLVTVTATSITDPAKFVSATIKID
jgi:hypothetical protein